MNIDELNSIFKKYYSFSDIAKRKLNIDDKQHYDLVIVSPTWKPHFVFNEDYSVEQMKIGSTSTYILYFNNKKILFIKSGKGAPNMFDNLLLLRNIDAPFIFLGSAGSLNESVQVGDIFIPHYSISGDGASLYFEKRIDPEKLFNKVFFSIDIKKHIESILNKNNFIYKEGGVFSIDTVGALSIFVGSFLALPVSLFILYKDKEKVNAQSIQEIMKFEVSCIEQETASFGKCMEIMRKDGLPILVISDSVISGTNYYEPIDNKKEYLLTRTKKLREIIGMY